MKKITYAAFVLVLLTPSVQAADTPYQVTLQKIVDKLDLTSFNNSIGPRREKGKITFRDYGVTNIKFDGKKTIIAKPDNSWEFYITLLDSTLEQPKICFVDIATNGGTYHSQEALLLTSEKSGYLKAVPVKETACFEYAK